MPIAHLKIYVQMIITAPRRRIGIVPYALKIGGQLIVSAELEISRYLPYWHKSSSKYRPSFESGFSRYEERSLSVYSVLVKLVTSNKNGQTAICIRQSPLFNLVIALFKKSSIAVFTLPSGISPL